jgi:hypothetical protein
MGVALMEKRFGIDQTMEVKLFTNVENNSIFHYEYDQETDCAEFYIIQSIDESIDMISVIYVIDMHHFRFTNFCKAETYMRLKNPRESFPSGFSAIKDITPEGMLDIPSMMDLVITLCGMLLVIHDRPERTRMIKETKVRNTSNINKSSNPRQNTKPDYAIRHILMTSNEAKSYIREAAKKGGTIKREYYVDLWERRGFWRKNRNGSMVYIAPTICNRHLELSKNKEVHIKL